MPQFKSYHRKCEMCGYETNASSNWCRHIKSKKHKDGLDALNLKNELLENQVKLLTLQLANAVNQYQ